MEQLSSTGKAILGFLASGARTGYDIKSAADHSTRHFWAASYGQIYPELRRLEEAGLVEGVDDPAGGRARRAFRLTAAGQAALEEWLRTAGGTVSELRDEHLLKLFFAGGAGRETARDIVRSKVAHHKATIERLEAVRPLASQAPSGLPLLVLEYGIGLHKYTVDFFKKAEKELA